MALIIVAIVVILLVWLYFARDRKRYRGRPSDGQRRTSEVFRDPTNGQILRVYEDPETGQREYRAE